MLLLILAALPLVDTAVEAAMKSWRVPGVAVVLVHDDKITHLKGYGSRHVDKRLPVTIDTLFPLSSNTKPFTAVLIAKAVQAKKLTWDDSPSKHLPWFRVSDAKVNRELTLRDMLCHRTGVGENLLLWYRANCSSEESAKGLAHVPMPFPFRKPSPYQSTMVATAGLAGARALEQSWTAALHREILDPLDMNRTCTSDKETLAKEDIAFPYRVGLDGAFQELPRIVGSHPDPAISLSSSAKELGQWLRMLLNDGKLGERQIIAKERLAELFSPQIEIPLSKNQSLMFPETKKFSAALGFMTFDYRGLRCVAHGGAIDGFRCYLLLVPEKRWGVMILANSDKEHLPHPLAFTLLDLQFSFPKRDWHRIHREALKNLQAANAEEWKKRLAERTGKKPTGELSDYVGDYEHPSYGMARVRLLRGALVWRWRDEECLLEHFDFDTFTMNSEMIDNPELSFSLDKARTPVAVTVTGRLDATFRRKSLPKGADR
jgi:CubicO group peptidase (beta-lactamase class C family)